MNIYIKYMITFLNLKSKIESIKMIYKHLWINQKSYQKNFKMKNKNFKL